MTNKELQKENATLRRVCAALMRRTERLRRRHRDLREFLHLGLLLDEEATGDTRDDAPGVKEAIQALD